MPTTTARIKVEAVGNIYFDISDTNFTITRLDTASPTSDRQYRDSPLSHCADTEPDPYRQPQHVAVTV